MFENELACSDHRPPDVLLFPAGPSRSLRRAVEALVLVHHGIRQLPDDDSVASIVADLGIRNSDFVTLNIALGNRPVALVCPTRSAWEGPAKALFLRMKVASRALGRPVMLVLEGFIRREPRLTNSLLIAGSEGTWLGLSERMKVLACLIEQGGQAPLSDLAGLIRSPDPVSDLMQMVVEGVLYMDLNQTLMPESIVHLVQPHD